MADFCNYRCLFVPCFIALFFPGLDGILPGSMYLGLRGVTDSLAHVEYNELNTFRLVVAKYLAT